MYRNLKNAFGKIYEKDLLSTNEIKEKFDALDYGDIIEKAYNGWIKSYNDGVCLLNCEIGELVTGSYSQGSGPIEGAHYIELYTVGRNWEPETDDEDDELEELLDINSDSVEQIEENFKDGLRDLEEMIKEENR